MAATLYLHCTCMYIRQCAYAKLNTQKIQSSCPLYVHASRSLDRLLPGSSDCYTPPDCCIHRPLAVRLLLLHRWRFQQAAWMAPLSQGSGSHLHARSTCSTYTSTYTYTYMYVHVCVHVYMYMYVLCIIMYVYMYMYMYNMYVHVNVLCMYM